MTTVQLLGSTTLARVALPWFLERGACRVVALDPGAEDESLPWFAPVRGLCRDLGVPLGRRDADAVLDLDPDARRDGPGVRLCGPGGTTPDFCRALLPRGLGTTGWTMVYGDGRRAFRSVALALDPADDGARVREEATLRGVEALAAGWGAEPDGDQPHPLTDPRRFRSSEARITWERPAAEIVGRIRALAGPYGGARTHVGDTPVAILAGERTGGAAGFSPGTIVDVDHGIVVAAGVDAVRVLVLRPSWRPPRRARDFAAEVGISAGYQLC